MKPIAIFRYARTEGPGHFATFLAERGLASTLVRLDEGDPVPAQSESFGGLGFFIFERPTFATEILVGAVGSIALALTADVAFAALQRRLTPWARGAAIGPDELPARGLGGTA